MTDEPFEQLVLWFMVGLGLLLAGGVNLGLRRRSVGFRALATPPVIALVVAGVWAFTENTSIAEQAGLILAGGLAICLVAGSDRLASLVALIRKPALRWGVLAGLGIATALGSVTYSEYQFERQNGLQVAELDGLASIPPTATPHDATALTDRGTPVQLLEPTAPRNETELEVLEGAFLRKPNVRDNVIRHQAATDRSNCHGWVFTAGRYWISGTEVERILVENRYRAITDPKPGDVVVYRAETKVLHTAVVRYVTDGQPVLVEGKWGCTGVYLHDATKSIYGSEFTYYRSPRNGHVLAGLENGSPTDPSHVYAIPIVPDPENPDDFTE